MGRWVDGGGGSAAGVAVPAGDEWGDGGGGSDAASAPGADAALRAADAALRRLGVDVRRQAEADRAFAARASLGVVQADFAVAETGSVVLLNSADAGRFPSLLPPVIWVFVPEARILSTVGEAVRSVADLGRRGGFPSAVQFITGPSRSADIEMRLTLGVHGPGVVLAQIVPEAPKVETSLSSVFRPHLHLT
ncbi:MAG: LUD domain-containing protein [Hydrogenibacillus schlegelii]|nr:LUD domain-containing protein [Hydrogenibacillus schlegelii]